MSQAAKQHQGFDEPVSLDTGSAADFIELMKPRVMSLVIFTALVGLVMAPGSLHPVIAWPLWC